MKRKLYRVLTALAVMAALLGGVTAPALADTGSIAISDVSVDLSTNIAGECAVYTFTFTLGEELPDPATDQILLAFPEEATLPTNPPTNPAPSQFRIYNNNLDPGGEQPAAVNPPAVTHTPDVIGGDNVEVYSLDVPDPGLEQGTPTMIVVGWDTGTSQPSCFINNPATSDPDGDPYNVYVRTTEEVWQPAEFTIQSPPVTLFLKWQVPEEDCGYKKLEPILGFQEIQDALDAANTIWEGGLVDQTDSYYPRWNLFNGCPAAGLPLTPAGEEYYGVPVGAVVGVAADFEGDGVADVYTETITMDTPGVMLASVPNLTSGVERAVIDPPDDVDKDVVSISAGGTSFGAVDIAVGTQPCGEDPEANFLNLYGFDVMTGTLTNNGIFADGEAGNPKCTESTPVFATNVLESGELVATADEAGEFELIGSTGLSAFDHSFTVGEKVVNLNTGWAVYVTQVANGDATELVRTVPGAPTTRIVVDDLDDADAAWYFAEGDLLAVFGQDTYHCQDARIEIRGNMVDGALANGILAQNAPFWIDDNTITRSVEDGIHAIDVECGGFKVCDGGGLDRMDSSMLQFSRNMISQSGFGGSHADWLCDDGPCFDDTGMGNDSAIDVESTESPTGGALDTLDILANELSNSMDAGLWLRNAQTCNINVEQNLFTDNHIFGLSNEVDLSDGSVGLNVKWNNFVGNGSMHQGSMVGWGVKNWDEDDDTFDLDVTENYFGSPFGPSEGPEPCAHQLSEQSDALGDGDAVSKFTEYDPWLYESFVTVLEDGVRYYGSDNISLTAGWNTLAVPTKLDMAGDELSEIQAGGQWLDGYITSYRFDGSAQQWSVADAFEVGAGYYMKVDAPSRFPVLYWGNWQADASPGFFPVYDGWNLVGSMFGVDKTTFAIDETDTMDANMALDSIGEVASNIVSPGVGDQTWWSGVYGTTPSPGDMETGEAYWVWATIPDQADQTQWALAGFEPVPFFLTPEVPLLWD